MDLRPSTLTSRYGWLHPSVLSAAVFSVYAGFAQFSATAALPDIAAAFGEQTTEGASLAAQIGLSGTTLGLGLAVIRGASVFALPVANRADRLGRRTVLLWVTAVGLALTAAAAISPSFWVFVVLFALARPLMSATNALAGVIASEETRSADRAKALAVVTVGYGLGAGIAPILRGFLGLGFRPLFALAGVLLVTAALAQRRLREPERSADLLARTPSTLVGQRLGAVPAELAPRLVVLAGLAFAVAFLTGPVNTFLFVYAENVAGVPTALLAVIVPAAGLFGASGLILGVKLADTIGRRRTAALAQLLLCATAVVTYALGPVGAVVGYVGTVFTGSVFAPSITAMGAEIFPTSIRATAAGWATLAGTVGAVLGLFTFGMAFDAYDSFTAAVLIVALPVAASAVGYRYLPETVGLELEDSAPERA